MKTFLLVCVCLTVFSQASAQIMQHYGKYRNFTIESETDSIYLVNITVYYEEEKWKANCTFNVTKDIHIKQIQAYGNRCSFETSHCEFYESKKCRNGLKFYVYQRDQPFTTIIDNITPELDIPIVKKNIYHAIGAYVDEKRAFTLYPNAIDYFWRLDVVFVDHRDRNAATLKFEYEIHKYVLKPKKLNPTTSEPAET